jgi:hypothetical protein
MSKKKAPIAVPMEDELVHTDAHPLCSDATCPCHDDEILLGQLGQAYALGLLTAEAAGDVFIGKRHFPFPFLCLLTQQQAHQGRRQS